MQPGGEKIGTRERIAKMLEKLSIEHVTVDSTKFPDMVKEHEFEHIRTE
ncbi:hypothetical protein [Aciduliprofundum sp. MAR08-339]